MSSLHRNIFKVFSGTMFSRVLGFVREMLQARFIGAGVEQSAFTMAFLVPNLFRRLFGEGALTAAFLPIFKEEVEQKRWKEAQRLANAVFGIVALVLGVSCYLDFWRLAAFSHFGTYRNAFPIRFGSFSRCCRMRSSFAERPMAWGF